MTDRNAGTVAIKLDLRGQEELKRRLDELGPAGERLGKDLEKAMKPAQQGMGLFGRATDEAKAGLDDLARRAGPVGSLLTSIGPWGLAAAAGLGALAAAAAQVFALMERSRETAIFAEELENLERASGITAERILSVSSAVEIAGGSLEGAMGSLEEFSKRLGEFRATGQGEARDGLQALGLEGLAESGATASEMLDQVLLRLQAIEDPSLRLSISDKLGLREAGPLLQRTSEELGQLLSTADEINAAFSDTTIARMAEGAMRIREAEARQEAAGRLQTVGFLEMEISLTEARADLDERIAAALNYTIDERDRETAALEDQRDLMVEITRWMGVIPGLQSASLREAERLNEVLRERAMYDQAIRSEDAAAAYQTMLTSWQRESAAPDPDSLISLERRRELEALIEAQLRAMQTPLERVAELETDLNEAREAGLEISQAQIAAILDHQRGALGLSTKLASLTEEERKLMGSVQGVEGPLERQKDLLESLTGPVEALEIRLLDLYAVLAQSPEHTDLLMAEIARVKDSLYGDDDDQRDGDDRNELFPNLSKIAEEAANTREQLDRLASDGVGILGDELRDLRRGTDSAAEAFEDMVRRMIEAWAEMQIQQNLLGPLAGFLEAGLSAAFGGGNVKAGVKHAGGAIGEPGGPSRAVPLSLFSNAPRAHTGGFFGDDEFPLIGKRGERMLNPSENSALLALLDRAAGGMGGQVSVRFHNAPDAVRVKESRGPDGVELDVLFEAVDRRAGETAANVAGEMTKRGGRNTADMLQSDQLLRG